MEKGLVELFESAKKAADAASINDVLSSGPEVSRCIEALKLLKDFPVTYDILVSTQVGKRLRHLTKHSKEKIQIAASDLLEVWKKIVIDETTKNRKNGESMETNTVEKKASTVKKAETITRSDSLNRGAGSRSEMIKIEKRDANLSSVTSETVKIENTHKEEKPSSSIKNPTQPRSGPLKLTSMIKCNDPSRDKVRELICEAFSKVFSEADDEIKDEVNSCDPIRVSVSVESVMFEKMGRVNGAQKLKYRSIMFNLKDQNNPDLRRKVLMGEIMPENLINLKPDEMASDSRQRENKLIKEKALFECERAGAPKATTDQFKCGRCGQRKTTYYQLQTRSADEPMTTFVTCVNCNNHWKFC